MAVHFYSGRTNKWCTFRCIPASPTESHILLLRKKMTLLPFTEQLFVYWQLPKTSCMEGLRERWQLSIFQWSPHFPFKAVHERLPLLHLLGHWFQVKGLLLLPYLTYMSTCKYILLRLFFGLIPLESFQGCTDYSLRYIMYITEPEYITSNLLSLGGSILLLLLKSSKT